MLKKIDHLGIAVRSLDEAVPYYEQALGLKCEHREEVPSQKVRTDIGFQLGRAAGAGVKLIHEKPFDGAAGKLVAFLHPKSTFGVLTEFCMPKPGADSTH
jgi:methylmalonyl-CoA/ethylmalonyl-CoA epimerase